ncbi:hypothetical protein ACTXT7_017642 [Hymenolepis weldensis]
MAWHDGRKPWEVNEQHHAKDLQVSEGTTMCKECCPSRPRIQISYIFGRGRQFMWTKTTQENGLMRAKLLLEKLKHSEEEECLWLISKLKTSTRMKKSLKEGVRVSADADADVNAYVETLQTIVIKPPWIDGVVNGGGPYVF